MTITLTDENGIEQDYDVDYSIYGEYVPESKYLRNGDPGNPAEYPELEINRILNAEGQVVDFDSFDEDDQKYIERECFRDREEYCEIYNDY